MMLTIHGLPLSVKYQDLKSLIKEKCNISDYILDNLVSEGDGTKKVRIGLADEREGSYFIKCLDGFRMAGNILRILPVGKPAPSNLQQNFDQSGGYPPRNDYPNQSGPNYGQPARSLDSMGRPDMIRPDRPEAPRQGSWEPGNNQWGPNQHPQGSHQMGQPPMHQNNFNYQQPQAPQGMNAPYGQHLQGARPDIRPSYDQRDQYQGQGRVPSQNQGYGFPKNDIPDLGQDKRAHVLRSVEIIDEPMSRPIAQPQRYPGAPYEQTQQKPITIMKENFQGPQYNLDRQSVPQYQGTGASQALPNHGAMHPGGHGPPLQMPGHQAGASPWTQPIQPEKLPFAKLSPTGFDRKYAEPDKRPTMSKPPIEPSRNVHDPYNKDYGAKPGPRFSPRRDSPPGRRMSPSGRRMSPPGRRTSPPGRRTSPPGRRISPPGRRLSPPGRRTSPPGRRMSPPGRRMSPPGKRMSSPGRRSSPGKISPGRSRDPPLRRPITPPHKRHDSPGRYSPSRRHMDKPGDKYGSDSRPLKDVRPAYDPPTQAPNQAMYSGGYRPSLHENVQYPIPGTRQPEPRASPWQEQHKPIFPAGAKKEDDRRMPKFEPRIDAEMKRSRSPRKSRSPIRRDRSPPRDRYKKHSPSPRSPRRSWALEKRRSPEIREAPPPPLWPGQSRDEEQFRRFPDRAEENKKRTPVWEGRRPEDERRFDDPIRIRTDLGGRPHMEPSPRSGYKPEDRFAPREPKFEPRESKFEPREPKFEPREPKFEPRESKFEPREPKFEPREEFRRPDDKRFESDFRDSQRPTDGNRHDRRGEFGREDFPRREEERKVPKVPETFNREIEDVYKRAQELNKRAEELRRREDRRRDELERRDERDPNFDRKFDRREERPRDERSDFRHDERREPSWKTEFRRNAISPTLKAKRDKAVDEISNKIIDKHGEHFKGEMRSRIFEEMRLNVGKIMQEIFGTSDVSFIEMVVKFNAKYDAKAEARMYNDVLTSLPSHFRSLQASKRPANDPIRTEVPAKSARHSHEADLIRDAKSASETYKRPLSRTVKSAYKVRPEPKTQRKTVRNVVSSRLEKPDSKKTTTSSKTTSEKQVKEVKPELSKELEAKIARLQPMEPNAEGYYELAQQMSSALSSELQTIMNKVWQELPDTPSSEAEKLVAEKFRNEAGDDLRKALGLNVTKRILNVHNSLYVKIEFERQPMMQSPSIQKFVRWLNIAALKRVLDGAHCYVAHLRKQADFDRATRHSVVRIGGIKAKITPHYKWTTCPSKLKTIYKIATKKPAVQTTEKDKEEKENKENTDASKATETTTQDNGAVFKKPAQVVSKKVESNPDTAMKPPVDKKVPVTKTSTKVETPPKKDVNASKTTATKPSAKKTKTTEKTKPTQAVAKPVASATKATSNKLDKAKHRKNNDFDELGDEDILALMSNAIVLDECTGSDED